MTTDELKSFITQIGHLIDKRADTTETRLKAYLNQELVKAESHMVRTLKEEIESAKEELRGEILTSRAEAKEDHNRLYKKLQSHERRIENLEKSTNTPNPEKN